MGYRIAYFNPWLNASEHQGFMSLADAASKTEHEVFHCVNTAEIHECKPDFVIVMTQFLAKLADYPTYDAMHTNPVIYVEDYDLYKNWQTYDGLMTIMEKIKEYAEDGLAGLGRGYPVGRYYDTPQRISLTCDLEKILKNNALKLTYFGINWDNRKSEHLASLSKLGLLEIYGPERFWEHLNLPTYRGCTPFDGITNQRIYSENGIGLNVLGDGHHEGDVISTRLFEIVSCGAICISCDIPWVHEHFGDSVYYVDQDAPTGEFVDQVGKVLAEIQKNPEVAIEKAKRARQIFDEKFAADVMLQDSIDYHETMVAYHQRRRAARAERFPEPTISVIRRLPTGMDKMDIYKDIKATVIEIGKQTYGKYNLIVVCDQQLTEMAWGKAENVVGVKTIVHPDDNPVLQLRAGLCASQDDFFAILDPEHSWFSNHFDTLFDQYGPSLQHRFRAFSAGIKVFPEPYKNRGGHDETYGLSNFGAKTGPDFWANNEGVYASNCFVASTALLRNGEGISSTELAESETMIITTLMATDDVAFTHYATALHPAQNEEDRIKKKGENEGRFYRMLIRHQRTLNRPMSGGYSVERIFARLRENYYNAYALAYNKIEVPGDRIIATRTRKAYTRVADPRVTRGALNLDRRFFKTEGVFQVVDRTPQPPVILMMQNKVRTIAQYHFAAQVSVQKEFLLVVEVLVMKGVLQLAINEKNSPNNKEVVTLPASEKVYEVQFTVKDLDKYGDLMFYNDGLEYSEIGLLGIYVAM